MSAFDGRDPSAISPAPFQVPSKAAQYLRSHRSLTHYEPGRAGINEGNSNRCNLKFEFDSLPESLQTARGVDEAVDLVASFRRRNEGLHQDCSFWLSHLGHGAVSKSIA